jgi:hypothetical protein
VTSVRTVLRMMLIAVIALALVGAPAAHASAKPSKCIVPDVVGTQVTWAKWKLKRAQCGVRVVVPRSARGVETVASQSSAPGRLVRHGYVVRVVLGTPTPCYPRHRATVIARDAEMVLTMRYLSEDQTLFEACVRQTGFWVTVMAVDSIAGVAEESVEQAQIAGTRVAFALVQTGKYGSSTEIVSRDVAATGAKVSDIELSASDEVDALALNPAGAIAWVTRARGVSQQQPFEQVQLSVLAHTTTLDSGQSELTNLTVDDTSVHWFNNGIAKSAPLET